VEYSLLDLRLFLEELEERTETQPVSQGNLVASSYERLHNPLLDGPLRRKSGWA
jgi:hypothetical protein